MSAIRQTQFGVITEHFDRADGGLIVKAIARHPGVLTYHTPQGPRNELVSANLLKRLDSDGYPIAAQLANLVITNDHPTQLLRDDLARIDAAKVGRTQRKVEIYQDGETEVVMHVFRQDAIDDIKAGRKTGVSLGYTCGSRMDSGVYQGQPYSLIQEEPFYADHLAICAIPRAPNARIRLDALGDVDIARAYFDSGCIDLDRVRGRAMASITTLENVRIDDVPEAAAMAYGQLLRERQDMQKKMLDMEEEEQEDQKKMDQLLRELELEQARVDELEASTEGGAGRMDAATALTLPEVVKHLDQTVCDRVDTWSRILQRIGPALGASRLDSTLAAFEIKDGAMGIDPRMDVSSIQKAAVEAATDVKLDGRSDDYIRARFDALMENTQQVSAASPHIDSTVRLRTALNQAGGINNAGRRPSAAHYRQQRMDQDYQRSRMIAGA